MKDKWAELRGRVEDRMKTELVMVDNCVPLGHLKKTYGVIKYSPWASLQAVVVWMNELDEQEKKESNGEVGGT